MLCSDLEGICCLIETDNILAVSAMVTKAILGESTTTFPCAPGMVRVALKNSSSSKMLSVRVSTVSVTLVEPTGMDALKDPLV